MIMRVPTDQRPNIVGSTSGPEVPFPIRAGGEVIKGFGRGSKELGIPTANLPIEGCSIGGHNDIESGIYFGWAGLEEDGDTVEDGNSEIAGPRGTDPSIADAAGTTAAPRDEEGVSANRGVIERLNENDGPPAKDASTTRKKKFHVYPMVMSIGWNPFFKNTQRSMEVHIMHTFAHDFYGKQLNALIMGFIRPEYDYVSTEALIEDIRFDIKVAKNSLDREAWSSKAADEYLLGSH